MSWSLSDLVVPAAAAAASLVAAVVGLQQILMGPRLRHLETQLRDALSVATDENQRAVLRSMYAAVMGRIVAREAVPGLLFLGAALQIGIGLAGSVVMGLRYPDEWQPATLAGSTAIMWFGVRQSMRLVGERLRIAKAYERGEAPLRAYTDTLARMEGGSRWEIGLSALAAFGMALAANRGAASFLQETPIALTDYVGPTLVGAALVGWSLRVAWIRLRRSGTAEPINPADSPGELWEHPRHAAAPRETDAEPQSEREPNSRWWQLRARWSQRGHTVRQSSVDEITRPTPH